MKDYSEWYPRLPSDELPRTVQAVMDFLFPHPVTPRNVLTVAERAFMREVRRRIGLLVTDFTGSLVTIDDVPGDKEDDLYLYRLTVRWGWPEGSTRGDGQRPAHVIRGTGSTPGQALAAVLRELT